jgi:hypothetical protein
MSDSAKANIPTGLLPPNVHFNTTAFDVMTGTAGVKDYFVFDTNLSNLSDNLQNGEWDTINGFEPGIDVILWSNWDGDDAIARVAQKKGESLLLGFFEDPNGEVGNYIQLAGILTPTPTPIDPVLVSGPFTWDLIV